MECFFHLIEAFHTQDEPAFCGLGTLVNVLNALEVDPGTLWKGVWRWYNEKMLDCCVDLAEVAKRGLTFDEWECLGRCQGLTVDSRRASGSTLAHFRGAVIDACGSTRKVLCLSYSRQPLGQTGDGHFSPVGGYHAARDLVLVLDCARFKYPPHWVPLERLWQAMLPEDPSTGRSRGYMLVSRDGDSQEACFVRLTLGVGRLSALRAYFGAGRRIAEAARSAGEELWLAMRQLPAPVAAVVAMVSCDTTECAADDRGRMDRLLGCLRRTPLHKALGQFLSDEAPLPLASEVAVVLLLLLPEVVSEESLAAALPLSLPLLRETEQRIATEACAEACEPPEKRQCCGQPPSTAAVLEQAEPRGLLGSEVTKTRARLRLLVASSPECGDSAPQPCCG